MSTKFILFLSTTLTAFTLATLYGVVTTMNTDPIPVQAAEMESVDQEVVNQSQEVAVPVVFQPSQLTPDQAALIAAEAIGRQDVYSVEYKTNPNGVEGFEVVFSSNDIVFISMNKMVYSISALPTQVVYFTDPAFTTPVVSSFDDNSNGSYDDDEDEDEHEDEDEYEYEDEHEEEEEHED